VRVSKNIDDASRLLTGSDEARLERKAESRRTVALSVVRREIEMTGSLPSVADLQEIARVTRLNILTMINEAGSGHPGSSLSAVDLIVALYFWKMHHRPDDPRWTERDRFILSKGHAAPALYAVLAEAGYFPASKLPTLRRVDSILQGHPDTVTPGVDVMTGSLGQGLSVANGIAIAAKLDRKGFRVYVLLGDGECDEGQVWEAAMTAAHHKLDNITVIIDRNMLQSDGSTESVKAKEPFPEKWRAFGWNVLEVDGHSFPEILNALNLAEAKKDVPTVIIARTVKGKGVSFMEGNGQYHSGAIGHEALSRALHEIENSKE